MFEMKIKTSLKLGFKMKYCSEKRWHGASSGIQRGMGGFNVSVIPRNWTLTGHVK